MIRIAYIVSTLKRCGPNSQLFNIISYLDRNDFDPVVITLSPETRDSVKDKFEIAGIDVRSLNLSRAAGALFAKNSLRKILCRLGVEVIHTQGMRADCLAAAVADKWPAVCSIRNFPQLDFPMTYGNLRGGAMARAHIKALKKVAAPVGVSSAVSKNLSDNFGISAQTICNGADTNIWTPANTEDVCALRKKRGFGEEIVWVSVGHLSERKDPICIIKAFMSANVKNAKLVFLGSGELENKCREIAIGDSRIIFAGRVENVMDWLRMADVFVSASHAEGFPNSVLEALACGLPCVLSNIPPHAEIYDKAKQSVELFGNGDLNVKIEQFEKKEALRKITRFVAEEVFSAKKMSEQYQKKYLELINA